MKVQVGDKVAMIDMTRGGLLVDVTVREVWFEPDDDDKGGLVIVEHDRTQGPLPLKRWRTIPMLLVPREQADL